jgi:hypothetical protein
MGMPKAHPSPNPKSRSRSSSKRASPLDELAQELALASRLDRTSILFVVTTTERVRRRAEQELASGLAEAGLSVEVLSAERVAENDIPMAVRARARGAKQVFFVHDLGRGGDRALNALNIRREYFTEGRVRVVLWLTPAEEAALARHATDFWSFRHRTVQLQE